MKKILITGSEGLIGSALNKVLTRKGYDVKMFDILSLNNNDIGDILDKKSLDEVVSGCSGIVHLAAVSRVIFGEQNPELCWSTNVVGTSNVIQAAINSAKKPWLIYSSSREVYGETNHMPVNEDCFLNPVNIYGKSKHEAEKNITKAREAGLQTAIVRLSNVYGDTNDYHDRVVPAYALAALKGGTIRIEGGANTFDFTHLNDTIRGLVSVIELLEYGEVKMPAIHFLTGKPTTLNELADIAKSNSSGNCKIIHSTPRSFDVSNFYGCPSRAKSILGWKPQIDIRTGFNRLVNDFKDSLYRTNSKMAISSPNIIQKMYHKARISAIRK